MVTISRRSSKRLIRFAIVGVAALGLVAPTMATTSSYAAPAGIDSSVLSPVDPQNWVRMDDQTWDDYKPLPKSFDWAHAGDGSQRVFKGAIVLVRFQDRNFVVSEDIDDDSPLFHPNSKLKAPVPENQVPQFYNDMLNNPDPGTVGSDLNHGRTIKEYWMEQTAGKLSVDMEVFGPYTLPGDYAQYGLNDSSMNFSPRLVDENNQARKTLDGATPGTTTNAMYCPAKYYTDDNYKLPVWSTTSKTLNYTGRGCSGNIRNDTLRLWANDPEIKSRVAKKFPDLGADAKVNPLALFDQVFYVTAGQDESSTWEEFGQMKWTQDTVPDLYGPPREYDNPSNPNGAKVFLNGYGDVVTQNWAKTRYIPWSSWAASQNQWPNANYQSVTSSSVLNSEFFDTPVGVTLAGNSTQAESSGMGTFAHEFSHILGISDNYGNPYGTEAPDGGPLRDTSGPWDILSRGSFGGPGGTHARYPIPSVAGGSQPAGVPLRNLIRLNLIDDNNLVSIGEDKIDSYGSISSTITAREVRRATDITGINIKFDGTGSTKYPAAKDASSGSCRRGTSTSTTSGSYNYGTLNPPFNWDCDGGRYDNYTVEVIDQMGTDSFTPDHGVTISKTKNADQAPFLWTIDANPQDIDTLDYIKPDGTPVPITRGDQRQLNDSLFHAGTESGSKYEYDDPYNGLHFYITNMRRDAEGVLQYDVAVRSTTSHGQVQRGVKVSAPVFTGTTDEDIVAVSVNVSNTQGKLNDALANHDIYRIVPQVDSRDWEVVLPEAITIVDSGASKEVKFYLHKLSAKATKDVSLSLSVTSENDATATATVAAAVPATAVVNPTPNPDVSAKTPATISAALVKGSVNVLQQAQVKIDVKGGATAASGKVLVTAGSDHKEAVLTNGSALVTLAKLPAGSHAVKVAYFGSTDVDSKVLNVGTLQVTKVAPKVVGKLAKATVKKTAKAKANVTVSATGTAVSGKVTATVTKSGKTVKVLTATLKSGKGAITLPKLKAGKYQVKFAYSGSANIAEKKGNSVTLTVK